MKKTLLYVVMAALLAMPVAIWSTTLFPGLGVAAYLYAAGRLLALLGFVLILIQLILSSKFKWIERGIGLDQLFRIHRKVGQIGLILVLCHPVFILSSDLLFGVPFRFPLAKLVGATALTALCTTVALALWYRRFGLKYEVWRTVHLINYVVLPLALLHSLTLGSDLSVGPLRWYWYALGTIYTLVLVHRVWRRFAIRRRPYTVASITPETHDTVTLCLDGPRVSHDPGQFMSVQLERDGRVSEAHPFTIASSPTSDQMCITVKAVGDFTATVPDTMTSARAFIDAPYGVFSFVRHDARDLVFIAAGIGITPFLSTMRYIRDKGLERNVLLLWGNKSEADVPCAAELEQISKDVPSCRIVHVMSKQPDFRGEKGRIDAALLQRYVADPDAAEFFICGPPAMMSGTVAALRGLGVPKSKIHFEAFAL